MGQIGFFDLSKRYTGWTPRTSLWRRSTRLFRGKTSVGVWMRCVGAPDKARKSRAGRKPWDAVVMFKTIILSALYNLSDDQVEHQIRDRLSFMRFLGLGLEDLVPDAKTVWLYREQLTQAGVIEAFIRDVRWPPEGSGLSGDGRPDHRRLDRGGSQTAQQPQGERADKGGRDAGMLAG